MGVPSSGEKAFALSLIERWQGILNERESGIFDAQPVLSGPGLPVYNDADRSLIGVSGQREGTIVVLSMKIIQDALPEMAAAQ